MTMAQDHAVPVSPVTGSRPELTISRASINNEPIELDSSPLSPEAMRLARRGSKAAALEALDADKTLTAEEKEQRTRLILERKSDPAVLVDIPRTPGADELEKSGAHQDESDPSRGETDLPTT